MQRMKNVDSVRTARRNQTQTRDNLSRSRLFVRGVSKSQRNQVHSRTRGKEWLYKQWVVNSQSVYSTEKG